MIISFKLLLRLYDTYWGFVKKQWRIVSFYLFEDHQDLIFFKFHLIRLQVYLGRMVYILMNPWIVSTSEVQRLKCIFVAMGLKSYLK